MATQDNTRFLNVDLDIYSSRALDALIAALGKKVLVLFAGREGRRHSAHLELARSGYGQSADVIIKGLVKLIKGLPPEASDAWHRATIRQFNVGIQSQMQPPLFELVLKTSTVAEIASIQAELAFTVYAPNPKLFRPRVRNSTAGESYNRAPDRSRVKPH
jgi:hypothetical protein